MLCCLVGVVSFLDISFVLLVFSSQLVFNRLATLPTLPNFTLRAPTTTIQDL